MDLGEIIKLIEEEPNLTGDMPDEICEFLDRMIEGEDKKAAYATISRFAVQATKNALIARFKEAKVEQDSRTVSSSDPCEPPEPVLRYCPNREYYAESLRCKDGENCPYCDGSGKWVEVPVILVDGPCDGQTFFVKDHLDHFIATSGEDGHEERQKYVWELGDNGERKWHSDLTEPGHGVFWMRWEECLGY